MTQESRAREKTKYCTCKKPAPDLTSGAGFYLSRPETACVAFFFSGDADTLPETVKSENEAAVAVVVKIWGAGALAVDRTGEIRQASVMSLFKRQRSSRPLMARLMAKTRGSPETGVFFQTVNLLAMPSVVRIHLPPPNPEKIRKTIFSGFFFLFSAAKVTKTGRVFFNNGRTKSGIKGQNRA